MAPQPPLVYDLVLEAHARRITSSGKEQKLTAEIVGQLDEYLSFDEQLGRFRSAMRRLESLGVAIPSTSRLRIYEKNLEWVINVAGPFVTQEVADRTACELREVDEFSEIIEGLPDAPTGVVVSKLRLLPKGRPDPDGESDTRVRDAQYELYLNTILRRGGLRVELEEPDLVVSSAESKIQIAAKRPASERKFDDRLRSATHQVARRAFPALIAISLDHVLRPTGTLLEVPSTTAIDPQLRSQMKGFVEKRAGAIAKRVAGRGVGALLLTARIPGRTVPDNLSFTGTLLHVERVAALGADSDAAIIAIADTIRTYLS